MIATIFFGFHPKRAFNLHLIINLAYASLKYRKMQVFLIFLIFNMLVRKENHTEIQKRTFEEY